jgi:AraC-like DNA-binding protein
MDVLSNVLSTFRIQAQVFHNGQFCGDWQIDTSGRNKASFHIVTHGHCELLLDEGTKHETSLNVGDLVLFPRDSEHRVSSSLKTNAALNAIESQPFSVGLQDNGTGMVCGYLEFEHKSSNYLFDLFADAVVIKSGQPPWDKTLMPLLTVLINESVTEQAGVQATLNRLAETIFTLLIREKVKNNQEATGFGAALQDNRIYSALEAIHNDPSKDWNIETLAQIAYMSRSAFSSKFKSLLKTTPANYIKRWRMQSAYRWLRDEKIAIVEAAERCGYGTEAAFSKAFKRELGVSPGQVRSC